MLRLKGRGEGQNATHKSRPAFNVMTVGYLELPRHSPAICELRLLGLM